MNYLNKKVRLTIEGVVTKETDDFVCIRGCFFQKSAFEIEVVPEPPFENCTVRQRTTGHLLSLGKNGYFDHLMRKCYAWGYGPYSADDFTPDAFEKVNLPQE